jgi:hypothetical protein
MIRRHWRTLIVFACLALSLASFGARAQEVPIVTGEHWTKSGPDHKKAYLLGIANLAQVELAYFGNNPPADTQSFIPRMARGLRGETVDSVRDALDRWYAANPARISRPVLEVIWVEIVVPGLKKP